MLHVPDFRHLNCKLTQRFTWLVDAALSLTMSACFCHCCCFSLAVLAGPLLAATHACMHMSELVREGDPLVS